MWYFTTAYHIWNPNEKQKYNLKDLDIKATDIASMGDYINKIDNYFSIENAINNEEVEDHIFNNNINKKNKIIKEITNKVMENIMALFKNNDHNDPIQTNINDGEDIIKLKQNISKLIGIENKKYILKYIEMFLDNT